MHGTPRLGRGRGERRANRVPQEIIEYSSPTEIACCNLASIALPRFVRNPYSSEARFDYAAFMEVVRRATETVNTVIDRNEYPLPEARNSNLRNRPVGLGVQGLADVYMMCRLPFESRAAARLNARIFEALYFAALSQSCDLARRHGAYASYARSPMSQGRLQMDMWDQTGWEAGPNARWAFGAGDVEVARWDPRPEEQWSWDELRMSIESVGVHNSLLVAPMPTAGTSHLLGNNEACEPFATNIFSRTGLAGTATIARRNFPLNKASPRLWA